MMIICKHCKYLAIAILFSGFLYSFFSIGIYLGEVISGLGNYVTRSKKTNPSKYFNNLFTVKSSVFHTAKSDDISSHQ